MPSNAKRELLSFAESALLFSEKGVSSCHVHWNRLILLHGAPGTGKTSLCRAMVHKLSIRLTPRFPRTTLLEIHSHSLFSKWFSTSGKLIHRLFELIRDMVESDPECLVCVLLDEIESLASSRAGMVVSSSEPTDALRAVNSLITSLDRLRSYPNVLVLATTNLTGAVDAAVWDRADWKVHIGPPSLQARYEMLRSSLQELVRTGIVLGGDSGTSNFLPSYDELCGDEEKKSNGDAEQTWSEQLLALATMAEGLSGRCLRRLPLQAHARSVRSSSSAVSFDTFLTALESAVSEELQNLETYGSGS